MLRIHSAVCFIVCVVVASACAKAEKALDTPNAVPQDSNVPNGNGGSAGAGNAAGAANVPDDSDDVPKCVPGTSNECFCSNGEKGAQICRSSGRYGTCVCEGGAATGGVSNASQGTSGAGGNGSSNPAAAGNGGTYGDSVSGSAGETNDDPVAGGSATENGGVDGSGRSDATAGNGGAQDTDIRPATGGAEHSVSNGGSAGAANGNPVVGGSAGETNDDPAAGGSAGAPPRIPCPNSNTFVVTIIKLRVNGAYESIDVGQLQTDVVGRTDCEEFDDRFECTIAPLVRFTTFHTTFVAISGTSETWMPGTVGGQCIVPRAHIIRQDFTDGTSRVLEEPTDYTPVDNGVDGCHWRVSPFKDPACM